MYALAYKKVNMILLCPLFKQIKPSHLEQVVSFKHKKLKYLAQDKGAHRSGK